MQCKRCDVKCIGVFCWKCSPKKPLSKENKIKSKPKSIKKIQKDKDQRTKDLLFYQEIWNERPHICQSCDKYIHGELLTIYIEHVLEKGVERFKHLRYNKNNIQIICSECHNCKSNGFPTEKYKLIIEDTMNKFNNDLL